MDDVSPPVGRSAAESAVGIVVERRVSGGT
jgi:hypothetical protein